MERRLFGVLLSIVALGSFVARAQDNPAAPRPPSTDSAQGLDLTTVYFPPKVPARSDSNLTPDDTAKKVESSIFNFRGAGGTYGNLQQGMNGGGVVGVLVFLDGATTALIVRSDYAAGTKSFPFAYSETDIKFRSRIPIDRDHVFWWGYGADVAGRGASGGSNVDPYLRVQPLAFIGIMKATKDPVTHERICQFQAFAKAAFGVFDNQNQGVEKWAWPWDGKGLTTWARPAPGTEGLINCGTVRVMADYQHAFSLTKDAGQTDQASVDFSKVWPVDNLMQMGFFTRAVGVVEWAAPGAPLNSAASQTRVIPSAFAGLELRFW